MHVTEPFVLIAQKIWGSNSNGLPAFRAQTIFLLNK